MAVLLMMILMLPSVNYARVTPGYAQYIVLQFNTRQIIQVGFCGAIGIVRDQNNVPSTYGLGWVDIGAMTKITIGLKGFEADLGIASGCPIMGIALYRSYFYPWKNFFVESKRQRYYWGYGISVAALISLQLERYTCAQDSSVLWSGGGGFGW